MSGYGDSVGALFKAAAVMLFVFVPLGAWKMVDIIIWVWAHVHFGATP